MSSPTGPTLTPEPAPVPAPAADGSRPPLDDPAPPSALRYVETSLDTAMRAREA